jgi:hypothetical protein
MVIAPRAREASVQISPLLAARRLPSEQRTLSSSHLDDRRASGQQLPGPGWPIRQNTPRWGAAAGFDGREAPRALTSAACLARSTDRARLWFKPDPNSKVYRTLNPEKARRRWDRLGNSGTGIWPGKMLPSVGAKWNALRVAADPVAKPAAHTRAESRGSRPSKEECGRETDSPLEGAVSSELVSDCQIPSWENTGNFIDFGLGRPNLSSKRLL